MAQETIKTIEEDDVILMLDYLSDVYSTPFDDNHDKNLIQERMHAAFDYIYSKLKEIADKHGITPQRLELIDEINDEEKKVKEEFRKQKDYEKLKAKYKDFNWRITRYIAQHIPNGCELIAVLSNPELSDRKQQMLDKWAEEDKNFPLDKPREVPLHDEDGWLIFGAGPLETEDEVKKRVAETLKEREEYLKQTEFSDTRELLIKWYKFICNIKELAQLKYNIAEINGRIAVKLQELKLKEFRDDTEFYSELLKIMEHDDKKERYWYHGTQDLESAYSICAQGLVMAKNNLSSTAYDEFSVEDVLLYSRGFGGEVGRDAIVIFKQPLDEKGRPTDIVHKNTENIEVLQSGMGGFQEGLDYIIPSEYIVGIVNKRDHKIIYTHEITQNQNLTN